jgi:hypothetical protein
MATRSKIRGRAGEIKTPSLLNLTGSFDVRPSQLQGLPATSKKGMMIAKKQY